MRPRALPAAVGLCALLSSLGLAAGPPPGLPAGAVGLIGRLGDEDVAARRAAAARLEALGERVVPALRRVGQSHPDVDVRLRAHAVAGAIHAKRWGLVRVFGPGAAVKTVSSGYWFNRVRFSRDGKQALVAGGAVVLYDLETGKELGRVLEVGGARPALEVAADGKHVLTGHSNAREYHLLEVPTLKVAKAITMPVYGTNALAFAPDGEHVALNNEQEPLYLFNLKTGRQVRRFEGHQGMPRRLAFSPDGKQLLVGLEKWASSPTRDLVVRYDVKSGKKRAFHGHTSHVTGVAFRDGGRQAVSSSDDGTLRVWDVATGRVVRAMTHGGRINDLAVSPDGRRALTAGYGDRCVKVWDLETGRQLEAFEGHMGAVLGVAFSPDGRRALSCDAVACVRLWKLGR